MSTCEKAVKDRFVRKRRLNLLDPSVPLQIPDSDAKRYHQLPIEEDCTRAAAVQVQSICLPKLELTEVQHLALLRSEHHMQPAGESENMTAQTAELSAEHAAALNGNAELLEAKVCLLSNKELVSSR